MLVNLRHQLANRRDEPPTESSPPPYGPRGGRSRRPDPNDPTDETPDVFRWSLPCSLSCMSGSYEEADERYESRDDDDRPPRLPVLRKESDRPYITMKSAAFARLTSGWRRRVAESSRSMLALLSIDVLERRREP